MKKLKHIFTLSIALICLICISIPSEAHSIYKSTPEDPEWKYMTEADRQNAVKIPASTTSSMTDQELVKAIKEYPYLIDIFAFSSIDMGIKHLEEKCDAYKELIARPNGAICLTEAINAERAVTAESSIRRDELAALLLYQPAFTSKSQICDFASIEEKTKAVATFGTPLYRSSYVTTPCGTKVPVITTSCPHSQAEHDDMDAEVLRSYPTVTRISRGSCRYNCHSYAWYSQSTNNPYWINSPAEYMTDGSYSKVMSGINNSSINASSGDRVFWGTNSSPIHSAILHSSSSGVPLATRIVYSKWGQLGVFKHQVATSPYSTSNVSVWHR